MDREFDKQCIPGKITIRVIVRIIWLIVDYIKLQQSGKVMYYLKLLKKSRINSEEYECLPKSQPVLI